LHFKRCRSANLESLLAVCLDYCSAWWARSSTIQVRCSAQTAHVSMPLCNCSAV